MARGIARVTIVGNLTRDPELRETGGGTSLCRLGVAVNSARKGQDGEWTEEVSFFDIVVWGNQGENCARYLSKGREVAVDGRLNQRRWQADDGSNRSKVEVVANQVVFMSGGAEAGGGQRQGGQQKQQPNSDLSPADDFKDINFGDEDDIPF